MKKLFLLFAALLTATVMNLQAEDITSWTIAGDQAMMGSHWDPKDTKNDMELKGGVYKLVKTAYLTEGGYDYKACANHAWGVKEVPSSTNQTLQIDNDGDYEIIFTLDAAGTTLTAAAVVPTPEITEIQITGDRVVGSTLTINPICSGFVPDWDSGMYYYQQAGESESSKFDLPYFTPTKAGNCRFSVKVMNMTHTQTYSKDTTIYIAAPAEPDMHDFLHFTSRKADGTGTVQLNKKASIETVADLTATFEYSKDRKNWTEYTWGDWISSVATGAAIALNQGDTVFFRAKGENGKNATMGYSFNAYFRFAFGADDSIAAGGNTMSLYDAKCEQDTMTAGGFYNLFSTNPSLVSVSELKLPAKKLAEDCYYTMFEKCTSLTTAPELPATTLPSYCYNGMFKDCSALTQAPELNATTLAYQCCYQMFQNCTALTVAPALPATKIAERCYACMFEGCTSLTAAPELKADSLANLCYYKMFSGCTSLQVDTCADGSCDGAKLEPTHSGTGEPTSWSKKMFENCHGAYANNIQLNGHYCIKEYVPQPDMHDFLYFVGLNGNDTVRLNKYAEKDLDKLTATFEYSKDRKTWTPYDTWATSAKPQYTYQGNPIALNQGDTVWFRALGVNKDGLNATIGVSNYAAFTFAFGTDDSIAAGGNTMSLYDATCEQDTMTASGFYMLFNGAKQLVSAPKLPATKLASGCYYFMFLNTNLTTAPTLPATTLANSCYYGMFKGCSALIKIPELKATILADNCYLQMFSQCTSLEIDTCADGNCDGVMFNPTHSGTAPSKWNRLMFALCHGTVTTPQLGGHYCIKEWVDTTDYLHFVGLNGNDTVRLDKYATKDQDKLTATFEYSKDRKTWTAYDTWATSAEPADTYQGNPIALNQGDTVFFRAKGTNGKNATLSYSVVSYFTFAFGADDSIAAGGNAMSLYDATCEQDTMTEKGFYKLFQKATQLVSAPKLPATQLAERCYNSMFQGCTSLTQAPELKVTTLTVSCYGSMFNGCSSLIAAPALPATTLTASCYAGMFRNCTTLTTAPELKATTLEKECYANMFRGCSSLQVDTCTGSCDGAELVVPNTTDAPTNWNSYMFDGCKGDAKYTAQFGIQLGGHYCIKRYYSCDEKILAFKPDISKLTAQPIIIAGLPIDVEASRLELAAKYAMYDADTVKKVDTIWYEVKYEGDAKFKPITNKDTVPLTIGQKAIYIRARIVTECNDTLAGIAPKYTARFPIAPQIEGMYDQWNIVLDVAQMYSDLAKFGIETIISQDSVKWYQVKNDADEVDPATGAVVDDELATPATGFYHTEGKAMNGQYYCVVALPEAKAVVGVSYFQSNVVFVATPAPTTPIRKVVKDGQLIIILDGVQYNAQGARL